MKKLILFLLLLAVPAFAQTPVYQAGVVTAGNPVVWAANRYVADGTLNGGFTSFLITNSLPSFNYSDALQSSGNYHLLQFGANSTSNAGLISYSAVGSASTQPLLFTINGGTISMTGSALTLGASGAAEGSLVIGGSTSGSATITTAAVAGTVTFKLPITNGTAGTPLLSGAGSGAMTWGSITGNTTEYVTYSGSAPTNNDCAAWNSSGNLVDTGSSCASSGVGAGGGGQIPYYATTGSSVVGNPNLNISTAALTIGVAGTSQGSLSLTGAAAGTFTIGVPSTITPYTITMPSAIPSAGQVLTAANGSGTMSWAVAGVSCCTYENANFNAAANTGYCIDTSAGTVTMTVEASPSATDAYLVMDCNNSFPANNLTVARNGHTIMNLAQNLLDNTINGNFILQWDSHGSNWVIH